MGSNGPGQESPCSDKFKNYRKIVLTYYFHWKLQEMLQNSYQYYLYNQNSRHRTVSRLRGKSF